MIGQTISHYKILEELGRGGMGVVYKAEDTRLRRVVALKFLSRGAVASHEAKARFTYEAQAAAALDHPNICTIHEIDEADEQVFISMAYRAAVLCFHPSRKGKTIVDTWSRNCWKWSFQS